MTSRPSAPPRPQLVAPGCTIAGRVVRFVVPDAAQLDRFQALLERPVAAPPSDRPAAGDRVGDALPAREVAVLPWPVDPLLALRLVEAGVHHVAPPGVLATHPLDDRAALRHRLGLRWDGDTDTFLRLVATLPDRWWFASGDDRPTLRLAPRLEGVRQDAVDVAGLPPTAAGLPSMAVVRRVICRLWCHPSAASSPLLLPPSAAASIPPTSR